eukprot:759789-Hanusia_phi.AAC.1
MADVVLFLDRLDLEDLVPRLLHCSAGHIIQQLESEREEEAAGATDLSGLVKLLAVVTRREEDVGTRLSALLSALLRQLGARLVSSEQQRLQDLVLLLPLTRGSELEEQVNQRLLPLLRSPQTCSRDLTPPLLLSLLLSLRAQPAAAELLSSCYLAFAFIPPARWSSAKLLARLLQQVTANKAERQEEPQRKAKAILARAIAALP